MNKMKKTIEIYCRVSSDQGAQFDHSLIAQEKAGIQKARLLGMNHKVHIEKVKSAGKDTLENRPVLKQLLSDSGNGLITDIFVTEMDRLTRSPDTLIFIKNVLMENNITLHTSLQTMNLRDEE